VPSVQSSAQRKSSPIATATLSHRFGLHVTVPARAVLAMPLADTADAVNEHHDPRRATSITFTEPSASCGLALFGCHFSPHPLNHLLIGCLLAF